MAQYLKTESIGSIGSIIWAILEVQVMSCLGTLVRGNSVSALESQELRQPSSWVYSHFGWIPLTATIRVFTKECCRYTAAHHVLVKGLLLSGGLVQRIPQLLIATSFWIPGTLNSLRLGVETGPGVEPQTRLPGSCCKHLKSSATEAVD